MMVANISDIQKLNYHCLKKIDSVKRTRGVRYFLAYGTLLGGIRHKGAIPWDSDIDILVPWDDYGALCDSLASEIQPPMKLYCAPADPEYGFLFARLGYEELPQELFHVDIFPLIGAPEKLSAQRIFLLAIRLLSLMYYVKKNPVNYPRSRWKKLLMPILKTLLFPIPAAMLYKLALKAFCAYDPETTCFCTNACGGYGLREVVPTQFYSDSVDIVYGEGQFSAPTMYNDILKGLYGDYMKYPSEKVQKEGLKLTATIPNGYAPYIEEHEYAQ
jgi:lipopolysaccharide cholinephosphotransferase